jgi:alpha-L-rhamnosidase
MGLLRREDWQARWVGDPTPPPADRNAPITPPVLRKEFVCDRSVARATLYMTALGLYEARINGRRVGDRLLAPEWTDYHKRVQYQTYDVTRMVRSGRNAVGALLGDGWYAGRIGLTEIVPNGPKRGIYGRKPRFLAQLEIEHRDGTRTTIATDGTWRCTTDGPIRTADILDGEHVDGRLALPGWDTPGFDDAAWRPVEAGDLGNAELVAQPNEPIRIVQDIRPVALTEPKPGVFVYDTGQNMPGWVRLRLRAKAGATITLRHAEALNDDGTIYTANLRGASQTDRYTASGKGAELFEPHFTYHGFRYVEVTGLDHKPRLTDLVGRVFCSSSPQVGTFQCSNARLNRLWLNALWTQRANLMSSPTDCPQRDERLGWMGDIQAYGQSAMFNMDMAGFFTKWLQDVRDAQAKDGRFPDFAPHPFGPDERFSGVPAWGDAGTFVPWHAWLFYGDRQLLEQHFEAARRWVDYIRANNPDLLWRKGRGNDYNDWLNGDTLIAKDWPKPGGSVPNEIFATAFFARSTEIVTRMAAALGRHEVVNTYGALHAGVKDAFNRAYVGPDGRMPGDTQAGYALALNFDLLPDAQRPKALAHLLAGLERYKGHASTGIQTTHRMMAELTRSGRNAEAYQLLTNRTFPSWLYSVDNGATTIWERWDGYVKGRGFQDPGMNSLNHWAFGSVVEWMDRVIVGINPDEAAPGFRRFSIRPLPGGGLTHASGSYHSIRGEIRVAWRVSRGRLTLDVTVPPNTTATVYVPTSDPGSVSEVGGASPAQPGVYEIGGGTYRFTARE